MPEAEHFVAREAELARLHAMLDIALNGAGQVCFVAGEAGTGKTALSEAFQAEAQARHADLVIAGGSCDAQVGDALPYGPFHDVLGALTSGVAGRVIAPKVKKENSARALKAGRLVLEAVAKFGPDLVSVFIPGTPFIGKLADFAMDQIGLRDKIKKKISSREAARPLVSSGALSGDQVIEQFVNVLRDLSARMPLLIVLDDLHWADAASIDMVFRLIRRLADCRIFIICAVRPNELEVDGAGRPHPLHKVINEAQRLRGDIWLDLTAVSEARGRAFTDALIDAEPNRLGAAFRDNLFAHTEGNPLFTIELLRDFRDRGVIKLDEAGAHALAAAVEWSAIPARVEGVIAGRLSGLAPELRRVLDIASAEGQEFTAELIGRVESRDGREVVRQLGGPLQNDLQLVRGLDTRRIGEQRLSRYRFSHQLVQKYLYDELDAAARSYLHEAIGLGLEALFGLQADEIAPQLARHFEAAGMSDKARRYLGRAAAQAARTFANEAALDFYSRALGLTPAADTAALIELLSGRERVLNVLGRRALQRADLDALQALALAPEHEDLRIELILRRASLALDISDIGAAIDAANAAEALAMAEDSVVRTDQRVAAILTRARAHFIRNEGEASRQALELGLALSRSAQLPAREGLALEQQGLLCWSVGDRHGARDKLKAALGLFRSVGDIRLEWSALNNLGVIASEERDLTGARRFFAEARSIVVRAGLRAAEARLLVNEGDAGYEAGDYELSVRCARQALDIAADVMDPRLESIAAGNLAETLLVIGDFGAARPLAENALALASSMDFGRAKCANSEYLARIHLALGKADLAIAAAEAGVTEAVRLGLQRRQCSLQIWLARGLTSLVRFDEALSAADTARVLALELGSPALAVQADAARVEVLLARAAPGDTGLAVKLLLPEAEVLGHSDSGGAPLEYPLWTSLIMIRALLAAGDGRAPEAARAAIEALKTRAARITDRGMRRSFVDDVPEHAAIQRLYAELSAKTG